MSDLWQSFITALERVIMLPSLLHSVFPSLPTPKRGRGHVARPCERNMEDYLREVRKLFEAPLQTQSLLAISGKLQEQFKQKLQSSNMCMLPSYNHTLPSGHECGTYLALDVGGSTFRMALVHLNGKEAGEEAMRIGKMVSYKIDNSVRELQGGAFFDWMADKIEKTLADPEIQAERGNTTLPMGLAWSFPLEQTSIRSGKLVAMGKGFRSMEGLAGRDLADTIMLSCEKKKLNVRMDAIVNDGTATLLSRAYKDSSTRLALILGTGTNMAVHLPVTALSPSKFGQRPKAWHDKAKHVLVNTEISMFGKNIYPTTRWDDCLNRNHSQPDFQPLEHLISGRYLGEIVRLILVEAIRTTELFGGEMPEKFLEPYALDTGIMAIFEADETTSLSKAATILQTNHPLSKTPSYADLVFVREICRLVSRRAAAYLAAGIHALWALRTAAEGLTPASAGRVSIGCNGSVIEKYPRFQTTSQYFIDEMVTMSGAELHSVLLEPAYESAIFGAAVAACCVENQ